MTYPKSMDYIKILRDCSVLIICIILLMHLTGCSVISKEHYFSPTVESPKSKLQRVKTRMPWEPLGGSPNCIIVHNDLATVKVISPTFDDTALLFGPAFFPIIPAFGFGKSQEFPTDISLIVILNPIGALNIDGEKITITTKEFGITYPVKPMVRISLSEDQRLHSSYNSQSNENQWLMLHKGVNIVIHLEVSYLDINEFVLHIDGLTVDGKPLILDHITFRKSSGFAWGM